MISITGRSLSLVSQHPFLAFQIGDRMKIVFLIFLLLQINYSYSNECPPIKNTEENPTEPLPNPNDFLSSKGDGVYQYQGNPNPSDGLYLSYWKVEKVTALEPTVNKSKEGLSPITCNLLEPYGTGTECMYGDYLLKTCSKWYELNITTGLCDITDLEACLDDVPPGLCSDGFPIEAGGYTNCDRPDLRQCDDGSYVRADTGICTTACNDFTSCYDHALGDSSCAGASYFEFNYTDPENYDFTCTQIDPDSPDHAGNGGNEDGNPYNDPNTPSQGDGSSPNTGNIDPHSLADLIDKELSDDFSNVERAVRDDIDQSKVNTETLETAINAANESVQEGISSAENNTNSVTAKMNVIGEKLDAINGSLNSGACDPNSPDYYQCLNTPASSLPSHSTTGGAETVEAAFENFNTRIENSEIVRSFFSMKNLFSTENSQCPKFSMDLRETPINKVLSTQIHCEIMEILKPIISSVMLVIYVWVGFRVFASS